MYTIRAFYDSLDEDIQYCDDCMCRMLADEDEVHKYCPYCKKRALPLSLRE